MEKIKETTGKILYGLLFVAVIPFLLILWARHTENVVRLPVPEILWPGYILLTIGIILIFSGMLHLWIFGKGLPMNAFPPENFVREGIYSFLKHPIYAGSVLACFGISVITRSSSGLWLVSPLFTIMIAAYLAGFENERTKILFGKQNYRTFLDLPVADNAMPSSGEITSSYLLVFIPWIIIYETFILAGIPSDAIATNMPFEKNLPVWEFSEILYLLTYLFALMVPLVISTRERLRRFITDLWFAIIITGLFYFAFPFIVHQRDFLPHSVAGKIILFERSMDGETCALPSFHVIWAFIWARYLTERRKRFGWLWYIVAISIAISCVMTGNHSVPDVIAGFLFYLIVRYRTEIWNLIRLLSERLANSWREWRWGAVRIINHGFYGGAAGFTGTFLAGCFIGPEKSFTVFIVMIFVIIGAGFWAQIIEGSPKLLRPYGYYGGVIGVLTASVLVSLTFKINFYILIASFAIAGPWIQVTGRLRCLVQGCCHGKPSDDKIGIRFTHPNSRVNKISGLKGVPLHPTQLYSIACNLVSGLVLLRLYSLGMPAVFITGIYFILNGLGRFVEESLRGEAQTPYWAGMRIYQWIAIINIALGAFLTTVPDNHTLSFQFNIGSLLLALVMGIIVMIASGVDFPESNKRFARLTSDSVI
jgi:protein-S-isoprenylcysteine O-methyltransferase Ste14/membrane-associated phospholipid phosphatase